MMVYGFFPGGDPRKFTPDEECSTEKEREQHRKDCELAAAGDAENTNRPPASTLEILPPGLCKNKDGTPSKGGPAFVLRARYGLGTYEVPDDEPEAQSA